MEIFRSWAIVAGLVIFSVTFALGDNTYADVQCHGCNVILISIDTIGAAHLGLYGAVHKTSPNIDRFSVDAHTYQNAYAPAPWTLPSHAAMLTGYYPWLLDLPDSTKKLPSNVPLLSETLKKHGYQTAAVTGGSFVSKKYGFQRGFDKFVENDPFRVKKDSKINVDESIQWLKGHYKKPFFLFLHIFQAHEPFYPSNEALKNIDPHYTGVMNDISFSRLVKIATGEEKPSVSDLNRISILYEAGIFEIDEQVGRLLDSVRQLGLDQNTVVILTSDHGEEIGEHGSWGCHATTVNEEVLRVPLIVRRPQTYGKKLEAVVSLIDLTPTILTYLGLPLSPHISGQVLPEADSEATASRAVFAQTFIDKQIQLNEMSEAVRLAESQKSVKKSESMMQSQLESKPFDQENRFLYRFSQAMVRVRNYKLIVRNYDSSVQLFDLQMDPHEKKDILSLKPEVASELKTRMLLEK